MINSFSKNNKTLAILATGCLVLFTGGFYLSRSEPVTPADNHIVQSGPLQSWLTLHGQLHAHSTINVSLKGDRQATLIDIAAEGSIVNAGDTLATFESSKLTKQMQRLEQDVKLHKNALIELTHATQPLQLSEIQLAIEETFSQLSTAKQYLVDTESLAQQNLVSAQELNRTREEHTRAQAKLISLNNRKEIISTHLHPAQTTVATTKLATAERELIEVINDIEDATINAAEQGVVWHVPLNINSDFRTARAGDVLYPNQAFLVIPDLSRIVAKALVVETEISQIHLGASAIVNAASLPDQRLNGKVVSIGRIPVQKPGYPAWQRYFPITVAINNAPVDLLPGLSASINILLFATDSATLIPRQLVQWELAEPFIYRIDCQRNSVKTSLRLGASDLMHFEVLEGIEVGDSIDTGQ